MKIDTCFECDGAVSVTRQRRTIRIGRRSATVEDEFFQCANCGLEFQTPAQMDATQQRAVDRIREDEGLLSSDEIRSIRAQYRLTQVQLERLLGAGPKTVVRWERGTVFQQKSTDTLLRLLREVPQAVEVLARMHSLDLQQASPSVDNDETRVSAFSFEVTPTRTGRDTPVIPIESHRAKVSGKKVDPDQTVTDMPKEALQ